MEFCSFCFKKPLCVNIRSWAFVFKKTWKQCLDSMVFTWPWLINTDCHCLMDFARSNCYLLDDRKYEMEKRKKEHTMSTEQPTQKELDQGHQGRWNTITTHFILLYYSTHLNEEPFGVATP